MCAHAILGDDVLVVPDTLEDDRFADNPAVTGPARVRFYAGVPLVLADGSRVGTLCVGDHRPRLLDEHQLDELRRLAALVVAELQPTSEDVRCAAMEERTPHEVLEMVGDEGVEFVDLRFCDLPGVMQHVSIPATVLDEGQFEDGHAFDGSSVRGFQEIQESDMVLVADPNTAYLDPFRARKTLVMHCFVADPVTGERYSRDPRYVAQKAEEHLFSTGVADTAYFGPEPEFFIFDDVRFETTPQRQLLPGRLGRGAVEHRHRRGPEPRLQAPHQGGLLPGAADGPLPGPALGHGGDAAPGRHRRPSCTTTRWPPAARARSASASTRCSRWPTS